MRPPRGTTSAGTGRPAATSAGMAGRRRTTTAAASTRCRWRTPWPGRGQRGTRSWWTPYPGTCRAGPGRCCGFQSCASSSPGTCSWSSVARSSALERGVQGWLGFLGVGLLRLAAALQPDQHDPGDQQHDTDHPRDQRADVLEPAEFVAAGRVEVHGLLHALRRHDDFAVEQHQALRPCGWVLQGLLLVLGGVQHATGLRIDPVGVRRRVVHRQGHHRLLHPDQRPWQLLGASLGGRHLLHEAVDRDAVDRARSCVAERHGPVEAGVEHVVGLLLVPIGNTYPETPVCRIVLLPLTFAPQQLTSWAVRRSKAARRVETAYSFRLVRSYR